MTSRARAPIRRGGGPALGFLAGLALSGAFAALFVRQVDFRLVEPVLGRLELGALFPILVTTAGLYLYKAFRWRNQLGPGRRVPLGSALRAIVEAQAVNTVAPFRAGDLLRGTLLARRRGLPAAELTATVALERALDLAALLAVGLPLLLLPGLPPWLGGVVLTLAMGAAAGLALGLALLLPGRRSGSLAALLTRALVRAFGSRWPRLPAVLTRLATGLAVPVRRLPVLLVLAVGEWALWALLVRVTLAGLGVPLPWTAALVVVLAANLATLLPAAPTGVGVFHYAVMTALESPAGGASPAVAAAGAVLTHLVVMLPPALVGLALLPGAGRKPAPPGYTGRPTEPPRRGSSRGPGRDGVSRARHGEDPRNRSLRVHRRSPLPTPGRGGSAGDGLRPTDQPDRGPAGAGRRVPDGGHP
ncbi:MAG TPA: lysylphosphatidylglycerol synthase transmembrane domain-containing protein [Gemmatimonadales bacterium]|nr:lysylphosphatidylglycerol synthase transmembrane domain-containing protein [Gemmatimonadales bacterium]